MLLQLSRWQRWLWFPEILSVANTASVRERDASMRLMAYGAMAPRELVLHSLSCACIVLTLMPPPLALTVDHADCNANHPARRLASFRKYEMRKALARSVMSHSTLDAHPHFFSSLCQRMLFPPLPRSYETRKALAQARPRIKGQFARQKPAGGDVCEPVEEAGGVITDQHDPAPCEVRRYPFSCIAAFCPLQCCVCR